ncbi:hypothetical protein [Ligilactobacillus equi]|uniref:Uncharacterized protein n=1 Tax=Ligilactobacillus equi DSM 15833 = JCM 10991 TaxID=1423740 RepID=A0A0R1TZP6_9LACO|nr:hypothetical protein [Ligilactobacillus equi]KRL84328.1 hypothetical protein FC36_GL000251 [Ligilactobacillus equi DSM 15833 = JCM 10991]
MKKRMQRKIENLRKEVEDCAWLMNTASPDELAYYMGDDDIVTYMFDSAQLNSKKTSILVGAYRQIIKEYR